MTPKAYSKIRVHNPVVRLAPSPSNPGRARFPNRDCWLHQHGVVPGEGLEVVSVEEYLNVFHNDYYGVGIPFFDGSLRRGRDGPYIIACICEQA